MEFQAIQLKFKEAVVLPIELLIMLLIRPLTQQLVSASPFEPSSRPALIQAYFLLPLINPFAS
jgi:hypothetical protein